jgi:diguanylate cyclase (GGDEF)-like protein/PAS domain S-box-containing protein
VVDRDGRIVFGSPAYRSMLGYDPDDLPGRLALSFVHPRDMRDAASAVAASLAGEPANARFRVRRRDAGWVVIDAATAPIPAAAGRPARVLLVGRDVTALVAAERRLHVAHEVARALATTTSRSAARLQVLEAIGDGLQWDAVAFWAVDERRGVLAFQDAWVLPGAGQATRFVDALAGVALAEGEGVAGRAWAERRPVWLADAWEAPSARGGRAAGLRASVAVPVVVGSDLLGVLQLAHRHARAEDGASLELLESIGRQLGQFLERRRAEDELRASEALKGAVVETALDCVAMLDDAGRVLDLNPAAEATFGYARGEALGRPMVDLLLPPRIRPRYREGIRRHVEADPRSDVVGRRLETTAVRRDGSRLPVEVTIVPVGVPGPAALCAVFRDITQRKLDEARIAHLAYHDPLTDLPNRQMLREHLAKAVARADRAGTDVALLFIDLDEFKLVNDSLGRVAGDAVMREVARRLSLAVRSTDLLAREAADEFLLLLADLPRDGHAGSLERAERAAASLAGALEPPFAVAGTEITVAASIGISIYPRDAASAAELLRNADAAMFQAKQLARGGAMSATGPPSGRGADLSLIARLRGALARKELSVLYQPIVRLPDEPETRPRVIGAEALVRWNDLGGELREPAEFIPYAERVGLIHQIGAFVFEQACAAASRWAAAGTPLAVSVNLSPAELWHPDTPERLVETARAHGVDPSMITIEVTESAVMRDPGQVAGVLARLREAGFGVAIDDFGIGHSSLERLAELPATVLKVDRSFVQRAPGDHVAAALVKTIVELAYRLDLEPIAEGIETTSHADFMTAVRCRLGQGYRYGRPMSGDAVAELARS